MSLLTSNFKPYTLPIILSGLAHFFLGTSALYWRELSEIPPTTLVAYRIILSTIMISVFILISRHFVHETIFKPRTLILHCTASVFIAINWGVFIWSSINGAILESGLGYLLAPFISIALGVVIYHEKIRTRALLSTGIALSSTILLITLTEKLNHWVYLLIASTWGIYTYIKKASTLDAISGLLIETLFLTACLALAIWLCGFTITPPNELMSQPTRLIWLAGVVSTTPLILFSYATGKVPLSLTGFLQFILPLTLIAVSLITFRPKFSGAIIVILTTLTIAMTVSITYAAVFKKRNQK